jgi:hypothetical protein
MNREDIIRMAHEVFDVQTDSRGRTTFSGDSYAIERFAEIVRKDYSTTHANLWLDRVHKFMLEEREACEALHDHEDVQAPVGNSSWGEAYQEGWGQGTAAYRDAIRARGQA